jgi:hypothetical protein
MHRAVHEWLCGPWLGMPIYDPLPKAMMAMNRTCWQVLRQRGYHPSFGLGLGVRGGFQSG